MCISKMAAHLVEEQDHAANGWRSKCRFTSYQLAAARNLTRAQIALVEGRNVRFHTHPQMCRRKVDSGAGK
jgi:hypothetical protein